MKNILLIAASRYGSTAQGAEWIAERLRLSGVGATVLAPESAPPPEGNDCAVLCSGIYAHHILPSLAAYIDNHLAALRSGKVAILGVSMSPKPVFVRGHVHGGLAHFEDLFAKLGDAVVHADMLGGQLAYDGLSAEDQRSMDQFYGMLGLDDAGIERRKAPRTLMKKEDYWSFAEDLLDKLDKVGRSGR
jgi:menaquinone-dependent protoporphyrinogen IX oxidase